MNLIRISEDRWIAIEHLESVQVLNSVITLKTHGGGYYVIQRGLGYYELTLKALKINP